MKNTILANRKPRKTKVERFTEMVIEACQENRITRGTIKLAQRLRDKFESENLAVLCVAGALPDSDLEKVAVEAVYQLENMK